LKIEATLLISLAVKILSNRSVSTLKENSFMKYFEQILKSKFSISFKFKPIDYQDQKMKK